MANASTRSKNNEPTTLEESCIEAGKLVDALIAKNLLDKGDRCVRLLEKLCPKDRVAETLKLATELITEDQSHSA